MGRSEVCVCVCGYGCVGMGVWVWVCGYGCVGMGVWVLVCVWVWVFHVQLTVSMQPTVVSLKNVSFLTLDNLNVMHSRSVAVESDSSKYTCLHACACCGACCGLSTAFIPSLLVLRSSSMGSQ